MCLRKAIKMAYNNFFPTSYQQMPYPQQAFQQNNISPQQPNMQNMQYQQSMTPPTIHAEIIQANKAEAMNFPVGLGQTQMFMAKDDSEIVVLKPKTYSAPPFLLSAVHMVKLEL